MGPAALPPHHDDSHDDDVAHAHDGHEHRKPFWLYVIAVVLVVGMVLFAIITTHRKNKHERDLAEAQKKAAAAGPHVAVAKVTRAPTERTVTLTADARALLSTTVYAKTSGYVVEMKCDKGDHLKKGDVIAILMSPETDAMVAAAQANLTLKKKVAARDRELELGGIVSLQEREQAEADLGTAVAQLTQAQTLSAYETIRAPFDGIVTARYVDPGALVPAATGATQAAMPVVDMAQSGIIRAWVYLGQDIVPFVRRGDSVRLWQDEAPETKWEAKVTELSGTLDPRTRTELVEIQFDNTKIAVVPGVYLRAEIKVRQAPLPLVPVDAITTRGGKLVVPVVKDDHIHFVPIVTGNNDGTHIVVTSGLSGDESVAINIPPELDDGAPVQAMPAPPPGADADAGAR